MYSLISFSDDKLRQAQKLRYILLNMDFKWLALFSLVVHLWPKLNVIHLELSNFYFTKQLGLSKNFNMNSLLVYLVLSVGMKRFIGLAISK